MSGYGLMESQCGKVVADRAYKVTVKAACKEEDVKAPEKLAFDWQGCATSTASGSFLLVHSSQWLVLVAAVVAQRFIQA